MAPKRSRISDPKYVDDALPAARAPSESSTPAPKKNVRRPPASKALSKPKTSLIPPTPPQPKARSYAPECFRLPAMGVNEDDIPGLKNLDGAVAVACIEAMTDHLARDTNNIGYEAFRKKLWEGEDADAMPLLVGWKTPADLNAQRVQAQKICKDILRHGESEAEKTHGDGNEHEERTHCRLSALKLYKESKREQDVRSLKSEADEVYKKNLVMIAQTAL